MHFNDVIIIMHLQMSDILLVTYLWSFQFGQSLVLLYPEFYKTSLKLEYFPEADYIMFLLKILS